MINLQAMLIGGVLTAAIAFGAGTQVGKGWEAGAAQKRTEQAVEAVKKASAKVIDEKIVEQNVLTTELNQCRAEIGKVNAAEAAKVAEAEALRAADQVRRDEAAARTEAAARDAAREVRALSVRLSTSLEAIRNVADECARAPVSADAKRMLDGILRPAP